MRICHIFLNSLSVIGERAQGGHECLVYYIKQNCGFHLEKNSQLHWIFDMISAGIHNLQKQIFPIV